MKRGAFREGLLAILDERKEGGAPGFFEGGGNPRFFGRGSCNYNSVANSKVFYLAQRPHPSPIRCGCGDLWCATSPRRTCVDRMPVRLGLNYDSQVVEPKILKLKRNLEVSVTPPHPTLL